MKAVEAFNQAWLDYAELRPGYPDELFAFVLECSQIATPADAVEVGVGTGQATSGFAQRGFRILGLEPGHELAAEARRRMATYPEVQIEQSTFEAWEPGERRFSLLYSAQAFHWVDPHVAVEKPLKVLHRAGAVALFWNAPVRQESRLRTEIDAAYELHAPVLAGSSPSAAKGVAQRVIDQFDAAGRYDKTGETQIPWTRQYSARDYVRLLGTYSDHIALPAEQRALLFTAIKHAIEAAGGIIEVQYESCCFVFRSHQ